MTESFSEWLTIIQDSPAMAAARGALVAIGGLVFARLIRSRLRLRSLDAQQAMVVQRGLSYAVLGVFFAWALKEVGFEPSAILGAAGILTVALGFASQTSVSNIISGVFLIAERPFSLGDLITVDTFTGEVIAVDLLSVRIRTFDNLQVRIPNETLLKSTVTTLTRFPIRRVDIPVGVAYKENIGHVREVLLAVAEHNPLCLEEPKPLINFEGFGASSLDFAFCVWTKRENFIKVKNLMAEQIKEAFDKHGIEIPFPHTTFYTGAECQPFPVQIIPTGATATEAAQPDPKSEP